ncbi:hypothetical protein [Thermosulfurimonas sp. F29]|uniref:hypothetical protein n=1 Tax=Thermosulfurimonas sp. F29 TaxID=2867247 RepID=UPI001C832113|nr:hypothetical protein [Thermosulfurimonas sp. F29]MBX6424144.1 hypothetical protein [Thermosulfurimonas sp. F29]
MKTCLWFCPENPDEGGVCAVWKSQAEAEIGCRECEGRSACGGPVTEVEFFGHSDKATIHCPADGGLRTPILCLANCRSARVRFTKKGDEVECGISGARRPLGTDLPDSFTTQNRVFMGDVLFSENGIPLALCRPDSPAGFLLTGDTEVTEEALSRPGVKRRCLIRMEIIPLDQEA